MDKDQATKVRERVSELLVTKIGQDENDSGLEATQGKGPGSLTESVDTIAHGLTSVLKVDEHHIDQFLTPFLTHNTIDEVVHRVEGLGRWMAAVDGQNNDGVMFTPVVIDYLAASPNLDLALSEIDNLRQETRAGRFKKEKNLQRDLEFKRFAHLDKMLNGQPVGSGKQYERFKALPTLPPPRLDEVELTEKHVNQAKRSAYQAACFLQFLRHFKNRADRPVVVVGNDRYGRQWVVEPLQAYLKGDFSVRCARVRSHASFRLRVPHEVERKVAEGFSQDFVRDLSDQMPHVVIVDARNPIRGPGMMKMSRGVRDYLNWFMVFNDLRAEGDFSRYEHESSSPSLGELRKWYEFDVAKRKIGEWVEPGPTYKVAHWAPELKEQVLLGDFAVPATYPDPTEGKPLVVAANADIFRNSGDGIHQWLQGTLPYYFDGPEKFVKEQVEFGFGEYGFETRVNGPTTDQFVAAVQRQITEGVEQLLEQGAIPPDGVIDRPA